MKLLIVKLVIIDYDANGETLLELDLINPDRKKLNELKQMIEHRHDVLFDENATDEAIEYAEEFNDNIWDNIYAFIDENFVVLDINEDYEIAY